MGMEAVPRTEKTLFCPSSLPGTTEAVLFGIAGGTVEEPAVTYLPELLRVTPELLTLAEPVTPTEVFRIAAPCAQSACRHFDGSDCRLIRNLVAWVPPRDAGIPACPLRSSCLWVRQEGRHACLRCSQVISTNESAGEGMRRASRWEDEAK